MQYRLGYTGVAQGKHSTSFIWKLPQFSPRLRFHSVYHILLPLRGVLPCEYKPGWLVSALASQRVTPVLMGYFQLNSHLSRGFQLDGGKAGWGCACVGVDLQHSRYTLVTGHSQHCLTAGARQCHCGQENLLCPGSVLSDTWRWSNVT